MSEVLKRGTVYWKQRIFFFFSFYLVDNQVSVECMDDGWNITVNLSLLRQKYPDFNPDECYIGLDNSNCTGHEEENQLHFGQNFEDCKTSEKVKFK